MVLIIYHYHVMFSERCGLYTQTESLRELGLWNNISAEIFEVGQSFKSPQALTITLCSKVITPFSTPTEFILQLFHLFFSLCHKYLLNIYYVPGSGLSFVHFFIAAMFVERKKTTKERKSDALRDDLFNFPQTASFSVLLNPQSCFFLSVFHCQPKSTNFLHSTP